MWQDWALQKTDDEIRIMHQYAETARLVTSFYTLLVYGLQIMYDIWMFMPDILDIISPMNESRPRRQPPFDYNYDILIDEDRHFTLIRFFILITLLYSPLIFLANVTLFVAFTQHVCAMFKLLGHRAEHLFYITGNEKKSDLNHGIKKRCGNMENLVRLHCNIIQFVGILRSCYTIQFLLDLTVCVLVISITLTEMSNLGDIEVAIRNIGLIILALNYLLVYNYMGQRIIDMSSSIYEKLYNSVWYNAVTSEQNSLLLIMRRCLYPLVLTASKFYVMSLQSFGKVTHGMLKYFLSLHESSLFSQMEHPEKCYCKLTRFFLSVTGMWPYQSVWSARLIRGINAVIALLIAFNQLITFFKPEITKEIIVLTLQIFSIVIVGLCHMYLHIGHLNNFKELLERMWQDLALQKTDDEIRIMHQYAETARLVTSFYTLLTYGLQIMYDIWMFMPDILDIISPMNESRPRRQPFDYNYDILIDEDRHFNLIRFFILITLLYSPLIFLANVTLFVAFTQHVCAMFKLLGHRAEHLFYITENKIESDLNHGIKKRCGNMANLVRLHCNIIQFVGILRSCYTIQFLLDLTVCVLVISITLTEMSNLGDIEVAIRNIGLIILALNYLLIYNYMGQRVIDMSSSIYEKLYNSVWYNAVTSEQNSLLLIMRRCLYPLVLTASKFYVMSLQSFGKVINVHEKL
ncbi:uncharacterized protein [Anoplolepis gracilipes]|uniref:uncharacterized protein n=1 Tax=Anoplolepis gracilipes TaxID=354296 RepID=UPI003BA2AA4B